MPEEKDTLRTVIVKGAFFSEPAALHAYLADTLHFPAYYGGNLSALADCLGDVDEPTLIRLETAGVQGTMVDYLARVATIMRREAETNTDLIFEAVPADV